MEMATILAAGDSTTAWAGVIGALGGTLLTGLFGWMAAARTERVQDRVAQRAQTSESARVRREAFAEYLGCALEASNAITSIVAAKREQGARLDRKSLEGVPEIRDWNRAGTRLLFLLDEAGADALDAFESDLIRDAIRAASGPIISWAAQIKPLLSAMRRVLPE